MRGKFAILALFAIGIGFLNFWNAHKIVHQTRELAKLETAHAAEKNINTELRVEHDDLRSGKHIASLVRVELNNSLPREQQGKIIYVHEPADSKDEANYCIIDLFASKAQAKEVQILLD
ncbi:MAG: hypothetical protein K0B87_04000 [Candidatus Syntrophosphaera sp.]|nr:hypothetical protein [Candidatus Syntrophosphaera sp.]